MIDIKNKFEEAKINRTAVFLKQYLDLDIDWNYMVEEINLSLSKKTIKELGETYIWKREQNLMVKDLFYLQLMNDFPTRNEILNETAHKFAKLFWNLDKYPLPEIQYFVNLVPKNSNISEDPNSPSHCDNWDVVFIQLIGTSTWNIYKNQGDVVPEQSELVSPGDVLLIPKGVYHEIYAHDPRAGLSIGYPDIE